MHSTLWASIFASAVVAVVTTLLVEYLAKPGLEARKERILESKRERRAALKNIDRATYLAGRLYSTYFLGRLESGGYNADLAHVLNEQADKMAAEIEALTSCAYEAMNVPAWMDEEWSKTTAVLIGFPILFRKSRAQPPADAWEEFDAAADKVDDFATLLVTAKWHLWRRHKLIRKLRSFSPSSSISYQASKQARQ